MSSLKSLLDEIKLRAQSLDILENESMKRHSSFRVGGEIFAILLPKSLEELEIILEAMRKHGEKPLILGKGCNSLVSDNFINKIAIKFGENFSECSFLSENVLEAYSGISTAKLANFAKDSSLTGLEFAHGIPASLGGAIFMNAGAYGGEMKDIIKSVKAINQDGEIITFSKEDCDFSYRHSKFSGGDFIIISAEIELLKGDKELIQGKMEELMEKRRTSQPLNFPSCGSTFKRPKTGYAAAMIDECGLKGFSVGGAMVSSKHAGFVVNANNASFSDVLAVVSHVKKEVYKKFSVELEEEIKIID